MEILESVGWFALGFVPALVALEVVAKVIAIRGAGTKTASSAEVEFAQVEPFKGKKKSGARLLPIGIGVESLYTGAPELMKDIQFGMEAADFEGFAPLPGLFSP